MARKKNNNIQIRYILIAVLLILIIIVAILSYTLKDDRQESRAEGFVKDVAVEIQKIITSPFKFVSNVVSDYLDLHDVRKENKILKNQIEEIDSLKAMNTELESEIQELKEELHIDHVLTDYEYLNATVVSRNTNYWYNTITVDKGTKNGIEYGMVVINAQGLIGKVINVTSFTADVRLITTSDTNNKISVTITNGDNKITGLINGYSYKNNSIEVEGVSNTEEVKVGNMVYTSGLGGVFPSGILVGTVDNISTDSFGLAKIINVKPSVSFDDINYVTILKRSDSN